jgi:SAM-dependent methyltransferase
MLTFVKQVVRPFIPPPILRWRRQVRAARANRRESPAELFGRVYREALWGADGSSFYSGYGSRVPELVEPYVAAVRQFLSRSARPPVVVEIGCGDFVVSARLTDLAKTYIACDVVPELIAYNRGLFPRANVTFLALDAVADRLPPGDVVIAKQVLQHLRNDQIAAIIRKFAQYRIWIICEHVPAGTFVANLDRVADGGTRLPLNSGVVLTERPFRVKPRETHVLSETAAENAIIRTVAYVF